MADLLGIDRSTYCCYERGKIIPDIKMIMKIANIFNVHYTLLLESESQKGLLGGERLSDIGFDNSADKHSGLSYNEMCLIATFRLLSEDSQKEAMELIINKFKCEREKKDRNEFFSNSNNDN